MTASRPIFMVVGLGGAFMVRYPVHDFGRCVWCLTFCGAWIFRWRRHISMNLCSGSLYQYEPCGAAPFVSKQRQYVEICNR